MIIVFLIIFNWARIKETFNNNVNNNVAETESRIENKQEEYIEKNLEDIKIIENETIDITYGQGCLIRSETTILFGLDSEGNVQKIKDFEKPYKVTSHGYVHCSEIIGEFSSGDKFYIHAQDISSFEKIFKAIIREAGEEITVVEIEIKNDPSVYSQEEIVLEKNKAYMEKCKFLGILDKNIKTKSERFDDATPEKIIGY